MTEPNKQREAIEYIISVWDEVSGNWRETPDHVQRKFLEAEQALSQTQPTESLEQVLGELPATHKGYFVNLVNAKKVWVAQYGNAKWSFENDLMVEADTPLAAAQALRQKLRDEDII